MHVYVVVLTAWGTCVGGGHETRVTVCKGLMAINTMSRAIACLLGGDYPFSRTSSNNATLLDLGSRLGRPGVRGFTNANTQECCTLLGNCGVA